MSKDDRYDFEEPRTVKNVPLLPFALQVEYAPPCLGSVGSKPFLDDIQAQLLENQSAEKEGRTAEIVPIQCRLCKLYHLANQYDPVSVYSGTLFETYSNDRIGPSAPDSPVAPVGLVEFAVYEAMNSNVENLDFPGAGPVQVEAS